MSDINRPERIRRAKEMRALTDEQRDKLISAAGRKVIDCRARFGAAQVQSALAHEYRRPKKPDGVA